MADPRPSSRPAGRAGLGVGETGYTLRGMPFDATMVAGMGREAITVEALVGRLAQGGAP